MAYAGVLFAPTPVYSVAKPLVGEYQMPATPGPAGSGTPTNATAMLSVLPFFVGTTTTYDRLAYQLVTAVLTGGLRAGIYGWNAGNRFGAPLLLDFGALDLTTGSGSIVLGGAVSLTLTPGPYWVGTWLFSSVASPVGLCTNNNGSSGLLPTDGSVAVGTAVPRAMRLAAADPGSMPSTLPAGLVAFEGSVPIVQFRVAA